MKRISRVGGALVAAAIIAPAAFAVDETLFSERPDLVPAAVDQAGAAALLDAAASALTSAPHQSKLEFGMRATFAGETSSYRVAVTDGVANATGSRGTSSEILDKQATVVKFVVKGDRLYRSKAGDHPVVYTKTQVPESWAFARPTGLLRRPHSSAMSNWVEVAGGDRSARAPPRHHRAGDCEGAVLRPPGLGGRSGPRERHRPV
jgi:hypothetical protein